jgi:hypothetical protein
VGDGIDERGERGHTGDAVGDGVVHLHEEPHTLVRQSGQEPHLPQRPGPVQRASAERFVQGDERPDVLGPALLLRPDQHEIRSGHAIEPDRLAFDVRRILSPCMPPVVTSSAGMGRP